MRDNEQREERGFRLVQHYDGLPGVESGAPHDQHLTDILADLRHFAQSHGIDFERAAAMAETHFECETE